MANHQKKQGNPYSTWVILLITACMLTMQSCRVFKKKCDCPPAFSRIEQSPTKMH